MAKVEIEAWDALCGGMETFRINGVDAELADFGKMLDLKPENVPDYGCGDMQFVSTEPRRSVYAYYKINFEEYNQICEHLRKALAFGRCVACE